MTDNILLDFTGPTEKVPLTLWPGDEDYGPFKFDCSGACATGITISDATITACRDDESRDLIAPGSQAIDETDVYLKFSVKDDKDAGSYFLRFELTLSNGATKWLRFGPIVVNGWDSCST